MELVVGVAAPNDLARSIIVEILHCGKGGDVEQVALTSKQISHVCDCLSLSLSFVFISYFLLLLTSLYS